MFGSFGAIQFEVSANRIRTVDNLRVESSARVATHEVIGRVPVTEFTGPGAGAASLSIRLDRARGVDPRAEITRLRAMMDAGTVAALVLGGKNVGRAGELYLIESMSEDWTRVSKTGALLVATVELQLRAYLPTAAPSSGSRSGGTVPKKNTRKR